MFFSGGDAWKGYGDSPSGGYSNTFGSRTGFNTGIALGDSNLHAQVGGSIGFYDWRGRWIGDGHSSEPEIQLFLSTGVFKRSDVESGDRWSYGAVWDVMNDNNYGIAGNELTLSQLRAQLGYALNESNEIGLWTAFATSSSHRFVGNYLYGNEKLRSVNQINLFWHHNWKFGGDTTAYVGLADRVSDVTVGLLGNAPLNEYVALYGNLNYYVPSAGAGDGGVTEEFWNVSFGLAFYPGAKSVNPTVSGRKGLPLLDVANNGTFQVTR